MNEERINEIRDFLKNYDDREIKIMEVCGSHTAAVAKYGIRSLLSEKIHLVSGPGCPVCVTTSAYVDRLIDLSMEDKNVIVTFGDMLRVPGSSTCLNEAKGRGAGVEMVYSPMDIIELAKNEIDKTFIFAAVGFETTTPVYALLMEDIISNNLENIKLLTSVKTMPEVINTIMEGGSDIDGFIAPGHVSVVTGSSVFTDIAKKYGIPFGVAGFEGKELLAAIYGIVKNVGNGVVKNYYPSVVTDEGNTKAKELIDKYFEKTDAVWRGFGRVKGSGRVLKSEFVRYDAGSIDLDEDVKINPACRCPDVLSGKLYPNECPLFGKVCKPLTPQGACMVSEEGSCHAFFVNSVKVP